MKFILLLLLYSFAAFGFLVALACCWLSLCERWHEWQYARRDRKAAAEHAAKDSVAALEYAQQLAISIWDKHYKNAASGEPDHSGWRAAADLLGVLTQIGNMVAGLSRRKDDPTKEDES